MRKSEKESDFQGAKAFQKKLKSLACQEHQKH
jgi:hypothetical protein